MIRFVDDRFEIRMAAELYLLIRSWIICEKAKSNVNEAALGHRQIEDKGVKSSNES